ncbi:hypothetical protein [Sporosarcina sp. FSL K6-5500]|uniref:hypothetical protein n=1 Tax=Sporosarcina sp. FSL K6-5500 TaxID=2921558 RepID=UPI0030FB1CBB
MKINEWTIDISENLKTYWDKDNNRLAVLTKDDDEIHLTLEFDEENNVVIHPRWNVNFILNGEKSIKITTNS